MTPALPAAQEPGRYAVALVCLGNICRSPMAHVVLEDRLAAAGLDDRVVVSSSGTGGWHVGDSMDSRAAGTLDGAGYDPTRHRAHQFDGWDGLDLVLAMDRSNLADLTPGVDDPDGGRLLLFRDFDPDDPGAEVPDPYYGGARGFEEVLTMVERTTDALVAALVDQAPWDSEGRSRMTRQPLVAKHAEDLLGAAVAATAPIAGGDTSTATKLRLSNGTTALMKTLPHAPDGFFEAEARGLRWLAETTAGGGVAVPSVLAVDQDCLIVAWVESAKASVDAAATFGRALATTHAAGAASYGSASDGFIGRLPLPNRPTDTWAEFYAVRRVLPYLKLARDRGAVEPGEATTIEAVIGRLTTLLPPEPPARLHGDLWNGNVLWGTDGTVWLIDPAAYGGHRELDLAMLSLFGMPHLPRAIEAYQDLSPLADGWEDRVGLHQLFPLLVHAAMFGGGYGARAAGVAARYAG